MRPRFSDTSVVAAVAATAFVNGLYGEWLDDDPVAITDNPDVQCPARGLAGLFDATALWSNDFWGTEMASDQSHLSYRPLTILSFRLQHCLVGFDSIHFHAVNVALHSLVSALFCLVCQALLPRRAQRLLASLLFALHAVHAECVTNTVGRAELLSAVGFFSALLLYRKAISKRRASSAPALAWLRRAAALGGTIALSGGAMLCKEVGLTALLLCAAHDIALFLGAPRSGRTVSEAIAVGVRVLVVGSGGVGLLYVRLDLNGWRTPQFSPADNTAAFCETARCRWLSYSHLCYLHLRLLIWPTDLAHDWSMRTVPNLLDTTDARTPRALAPYALLVALVASGLYALSRGRRGLFVSLTTGSALLVLPFVPASNLLVVVGFTVAERVLYLPSAGACVLIARLLVPAASTPAAPSARGKAAGRTTRWLRRLWPLLLLVFHAVLATRRNVDWRTHLGLLESGVEHQPTNAKLRYNLATLYHRYGGEGGAGGEGRQADAVHHLREARRLLPAFHEAACIEAAALRELGQRAESEALLRATLALAQKPPPPDAAALDARDDESNPAPYSIDAHVRQVRLEADATQRTLGVYYASRGLGGLLSDDGRYAEAARAFLPALELQPQDTALAQRVKQLLQASRAAATVPGRESTATPPARGAATPPSVPVATLPPAQRATGREAAAGTSRWATRLATRSTKST